MDLINVYVIYDITKFTKAKVIEEIKAEGYKHNFIFGADLTSGDDKRRYMKHCSEIWLWGECTKINDYCLAEEMGIELWQMG